MLTRQLLYTTITRAVGTFIAVGQLEALCAAVAQDKQARRYTQLSQFLLACDQELMEAMGSLGVGGGVSLKKQANLGQTLVRYLLLINSRVTAQSQQSDSDDKFQPVVIED